MRQLKRVNESERLLETVEEMIGILDKKLFDLPNIRYKNILKRILKDVEDKKELTKLDIDSFNDILFRLKEKSKDRLDLLEDEIKDLKSILNITSIKGSKLESTGFLVDGEYTVYHKPFLSSTEWIRDFTFDDLEEAKLEAQRESRNNTVSKVVNSKGKVVCKYKDMLEV